MRSFEGRYLRLSDENEYIVMECKPKIISLEIAREMIDQRLEFTGYEERYIFFDARNIKEVDKRARDLLSTDEGKEKIKGVAVFVNSTLTTFVVNYVIKVCYKNSSIPIRLFMDRQKALDWLLALKQTGRDMKPVL